MMQDATATALTPDESTPLVYELIDSDALEAEPIPPIEGWCQTLGLLHEWMQHTAQQRPDLELDFTICRSATDSDPWRVSLTAWCTIPGTGKVATTNNLIAAGIALPDSWDQYAAAYGMGRTLVAAARDALAIMYRKGLPEPLSRWIKP